MGELDARSMSVLPGEPVVPNEQMEVCFLIMLTPEKPCFYKCMLFLRPLFAAL